jgi:hypothetical protein
MSRTRLEYVPTDPFDCPNPSQQKLFESKEDLDRFLADTRIHPHSVVPTTPHSIEWPYILDYCVRNEAS